MDYKNEIKKLKKHRNSYYPVIKRILTLYNNFDDNKPPVEITDKNEMLVVLELIDVGHLQPDSFVVKKPFGEINSVHFNGEYPLTESGENLLRQKKMKANIVIIVALFGLVCMLILLYLFEWI